MENLFNGVYTAIVTPFDGAGNIDEAAFRNLIDFQIDNKIDGIVPCGTTGESPTLSHEEHDRVIELTVEQVNKALQTAAEGPLTGILEYCQEPLVSADFIGNPASSIVDALSTMVVAGNMVKTIAWYDNEWGYSCRLADLAAYIAAKGL